MPDRSTLLRLAVAALCLAAAAAIVALLTGSFDDTDVRVILTSLAYAVLSATAASGAAVRVRGSHARRLLGAATIVVSAATFVLLTALLWDLLDDTEGLERICGLFGLSAVALSHASLVVRGRRHGDIPAVAAIATASQVLAGADWLVGALLISGADAPDGAAPLIGVTLVLLVLTSVLPPILRRLAPAETTIGGSALQRLTTEVLQAADRIDAVTAEAAVRHETARLRDVARALAP